MARKLGTLAVGEAGTILSLQREPETSTLVDQLLAMGLIEGAVVQVVHEAPFSKDPIAVRVRGAIVALRRNEADLIEVGT